MLDWKLILTLAIGVILLASCAAPSGSQQEYGETAIQIPDEILASRFGISIVDQDIDEIASLGIRWAKPFARPSGGFTWGLLEPERGEYFWQSTDEYIQKVQGHNMALLAVIWPFAEWDQANWGPVADTEWVVFERWMGRSRRKPYDMDAYRRFVSALVER